MESNMKLNKSAILFLILIWSWSVLLSGCGSNSPAGSASSGTHTPTAIIGHSTSTATPPARTITLPPGCPAAGTTRAANMPVDTTAAEPSLFYLTTTLGAKMMVPLDLERYDLATGKTTTLYGFPGSYFPNPPLPSLSPDKDWLIFVSPDPKNLLNANTARLLLMRSDGSQLQTLSCGNVLLKEQNKLVWSPDGQQIAFTGPPTNVGLQFQGKQTIHVLNLRTGQEKLYLTNTGYVPYAWLDNQQLYVIEDTGDNPLSEMRVLSLFDTSPGSNQKPVNLESVASTYTVCGDFALSTDRQKIYSTTCSPIRDSCRGVSFQGLAGMNEQPATGGPGTMLFSRQDLAIVDIQPVDTRTVLLDIVDTHTG